MNLKKTGTDPQIHLENFRGFFFTFCSRLPCSFDHQGKFDGIHPWVRLDRSIGSHEAVNGFTFGVAFFRRRKVWHFHLGEFTGFFEAPQKSKGGSRVQGVQGPDGFSRDSENG